MDKKLKETMEEIESQSKKVSSMINDDTELMTLLKEQDRLFNMRIIFVLKFYRWAKREKRCPEELNIAAQNAVMQITIARAENPYNWDLEFFEKQKEEIRSTIK